MDKKLFVYIGKNGAELEVYAYTLVEAIAQVKAMVLAPPVIINAAWIETHVLEVK